MTAVIQNVGLGTAPAMAPPGAGLHRLRVDPFTRSCPGCRMLTHPASPMELNPAGDLL